MCAGQPSPARRRRRDLASRLRGLIPPPRRRPAKAPLLFVRPKARQFRPERTGMTYVYFYTTFDERTTKRRRGVLPRRRLLGNFSTALAGGRGAASASTASRSQAPRGGSSAPPIWWIPSSACPTPTLSGQRRSPRTVAALRGASWFGRELAACEGGIESTARAWGVGRSSGRASKLCRFGGARPRPAAIIPSTAFFASGSAAERQKRLRFERGTIERTLEGFAYVPRRRRCAFRPSNFMLRAPAKIEALIEPQPKRPSTRQSPKRRLPGHLSSQQEQDGVQPCLELRQTAGQKTPLIHRHLWL